MEKPEIVVPDWKVKRIEFDTETGTATVSRTKGSSIACYVLEFNHGSHGTWAVLVPVNDQSYTICVGQSGAMPSVTYLVMGKTSVPEVLPALSETEVVL